MVAAPTDTRPGPTGRGPKLGNAEAVKLRPLNAMHLKRPQLTGRSMMIIGMALFLVVVLASPLQTYLNRRDGVAATQHQQQELRDHVAQLQHESDQWQNPAFVERQARTRLQYVRPGDTLYTVLNPDGTPKADTSAAADSVPRSGHIPSWNSMLWTSVQNADHAK
ncbi:FtsB family cell division protein [Jatrophihabitans sp. DSM 45814]